MQKEQRETRQRKAIAEAFKEGARPLSPKEVLELASRNVPNLGIATVYRNIKNLVETGELEVVELPGQAARYCPPRQKRTPLLYCRKSDRVYHLERNGMDLELPELPDDFKIERTEVIIYGEFLGSAP